MVKNKTRRNRAWKRRFKKEGGVIVDKNLCPNCGESGKHFLTKDFVMTNKRPPKLKKSMLDIIEKSVIGLLPVTSFPPDGFYTCAICYGPDGRRLPGV